MDIRFFPHNTHFESAGTFETTDPHLRKLRQQSLVFRSGLLERLPRGKAGIFTLCGGRQVGKTTLVKQWMAELLRGGVVPGRIVYLTGELIDDHHSLVRLATETLGEMVSSGLRYLIIDEVTYIRDWDRGIKYLADAGVIDDTALLITGSDLVIIKEARVRFPGRRGTADVVDYQLHPLEFAETVELKGCFTADELACIADIDSEPEDYLLERLFGVFNQLEVKWTKQMRSKDLKQLGKYPHGRILGKSRRFDNIQGVPADPLPLALFRLRGCNERLEACAS